MLTNQTGYRHRLSKQKLPISMVSCLLGMGVFISPTSISADSPPTITIKFAADKDISSNLPKAPLSNAKPEENWKIRLSYQMKKAMVTILEILENLRTYLNFQMKKVMVMILENLKRPQNYQMKKVRVMI
ncbi:hypothetical protein [Streptococcus equi]|uniref:hypothetical protein n=1 Tax=Streptococcus equi TaxID=1336 RepID=UPI001E314A1C